MEPQEMAAKRCANRETLLTREGNPVLSRKEMISVWKPINGYEGYYEVSSSGEVRSLDRYVVEQSGKYAGKKRMIKGRLMKLTNSKSRGNKGYLVVNLHKNNISEIKLVHILVARAFIPNNDNLPTVNHIDGNKHNNTIDNLEWASFSDNNTHALSIGLRRPRGNPVTQYSLSHEFIKEYMSVSEASRASNISRGMISHCVNGRLKHAGNYIWEKASESPTTIPAGSTQEDELPAEAQRPSL